MRNGVLLIFDYCITYNDGIKYNGYFEDELVRILISRPVFKAFLNYMSSDGDLNSTDFPKPVNDIVMKVKETAIEIVNEKHPFFKDKEIDKIEISVDPLTFKEILRNKYNYVSGSTFIFIRNDSSKVELIVDDGWVEIYDSLKPYQYAEFEENHMADLLSKLVEKEICLQSYFIKNITPA